MVVASRRGTNRPHEHEEPTNHGFLVSPLVWGLRRGMQDPSVHVVLGAPDTIRYGSDEVSKLSVRGADSLLHLKSGSQGSCAGDSRTGNYRA